jgi:hypothetical protein
MFACTRVELYSVKASEREMDSCCYKLIMYLQRIIALNSVN